MKYLFLLLTLSLISCAHNRKVINIRQVNAQVEKEYFQTPESVPEEVAIELKKRVVINNSYNVSKTFGKKVKVGIIDHTYLNPENFSKVKIQHLYVKATDPNIAANFFNNHSDVVLQSLLEETKEIDLEIYSCILDSPIDMHECLSWLKEERVDAINMSIGISILSGKSYALMKEMLTSGIVMTVASGNRSMIAKDICAVFKELICVGALDEKNKPTDYSDFGPYVSAWENGSVIYQHQRNNGTSFAAPRHLGKIIKYNSIMNKVSAK